MNSKILIIYEYQILFEILNEIKESLNFQVIQSKQDDYNKLRLDPKINYLVISKNKTSNLSNNLFFVSSNIIVTKNFLNDCLEIPSRHLNNLLSIPIDGIIILIFDIKLFFKNRSHKTRLVSPVR